MNLREHMEEGVGGVEKELPCVYRVLEAAFCQFMYKSSGNV